MSSVRDLTIRLADLLRRERAAMAEFLLALSDFDQRRCWLELGHPSLFSYLHREMGLSKGAAYYRKVAADLVRRFPEVVDPLRDGRLCLTSVVELAKVINDENRSEVLPRFFHCSKQEAKAVSAELCPAQAAPHRDIVTALAARPCAAPRPLEHGAAQAGATAATVRIAGPCVTAVAVPDRGGPVRPDELSVPGRVRPDEAIAACMVRPDEVGPRFVHADEGAGPSVVRPDQALRPPMSHPDDPLAGPGRASRPASTVPEPSEPASRLDSTAPGQRAPARLESDGREQSVSLAHPPPGRRDQRDVTEPLTADLRRLHVTVSRRFLAKLDAARAALSHALPGATTEAVLEAALDLLLARDAKRKGLVETPRPEKPRAQEAGPEQTLPGRPIQERPPSNEHLSAAARRTVWQRDAGRCQWPVASGGICGSTLRLEIDHVVPRARGGASTPDNLRVLCGMHNGLAARQILGDACMDRFTRRSGERASAECGLPRGASPRRADSGSPTPCRTEP
jgi:hypothetical protein